MIIFSSLCTYHGPTFSFGFPGGLRRDARENILVEQLLVGYWHDHFFYWRSVEHSTLLTYEAGRSWRYNCATSANRFDVQHARSRFEELRGENPLRQASASLQEMLSTTMLEFKKQKIRSTACTY